MDAPKSTEMVEKAYEWAARGLKSYVLLLYEYLRISPSYEIARQVHMRELLLEDGLSRYIRLHEMEAGTKMDTQQSSSLEASFWSVLKTFDEFGDVSRASFNQWWSDKGLAIYGLAHARPQPHQIARISKDQPYDSAIGQAVLDYFEGHRSKEGKPEALIVSIPLGIDRRLLLRQVSRLIEKAGVPVPPRPQRAKRTMTGQRLRSKPLLIGIRLLMYRAVNPNWSLWQLGVVANVSPTHVPGLEVESKKHRNNSDQRATLAILTSRALRRAKTVAENAAHGEFPSSKARALPYFDFDDLHRRIRIARPNIRAKPASMRLKKAGVVLNDTQTNSTA